MSVAGKTTQKGNIIWIDRHIAEAEGIDVEKLVAFYAADGIRLITERAYFDDCEQRWVCPGCKVAYERDEETWRPYTIGGVADWQPLCRVCEGTELDPRTRAERLRKRRQWIGRVKKRPGKQVEVRAPVRHRPAGEGLAPRWRA